MDRGTQIPPTARDRVVLRLARPQQDQLQALITRRPAGTKYGALYRMMDENAVEQAGLAPLKPDLATVAAIATRPSWPATWARPTGGFGSKLFDYGVDPDTADATMNASTCQGGLGLPEPRLLPRTPQFATQREAYRAYIERTMQGIGTPDPAAAADTSWRSKPRSPSSAGRAPTAATSRRPTTR